MKKRNLAIGIIVLVVVIIVGFYFYFNGAVDEPSSDKCLEMECPAGSSGGLSSPAFRVKCGDPTGETDFCFERESDYFDCAVVDGECTSVGIKCVSDSECDEQKCEKCDVGRCATLCKENERCDNIDGGPLECYISCNGYNPCRNDLECREGKCV